MKMDLVEPRSRGRPALEWTPLRRRVHAKLCEFAANGEHITLGGLVRTCSLRDRSNARRVIRDLWKMGVLD